MNSLPFETRSRILKLLVEGSSIKLACGIEGVSKTTVLKLLAEVGEDCGRYYNQHLTGLACRDVEVKKLWSFSVRTDDLLLGMSKVYSWLAVDQETKLVVCCQIRVDSATSEKNFINDVINRLKTHVQFEVDGDRTFLRAVEGTHEPSVGHNIPFSMDNSKDGENGDGSSVVTERLNDETPLLKTSVIARKLTNHTRALNLHCMHYNFCRIQGPEIVTPAMNAGLADRVWNLVELLRTVEKFGVKRSG